MGGWTGRWVGGLVGGWVGGWEVLNDVNLSVEDCQIFIKIR